MLKFVLKFVCHRVEYIVGKEKNDGYQHFLLLPNFFSKRFSRERVRPKSSLYAKGLLQNIYSQRDDGLVLKISFRNTTHPKTGTVGHISSEKMYKS